METLVVSQTDLSNEVLKKIASKLLASKIVAFPTETVYGIGGHVFDTQAIEKIYDLKNRPKNKGLIVHLGKIEDAQKVACDIPDEFYVLANKFFPGPLTIVLKKKKGISSIVSDNSTIAVRMPYNKFTTELINLVGDPIVGTSANISDAQSPIRAKEVIDSFMNKIDVIIDGGECPIKLPSTIINLRDSGYEILRRGSISEEQIDTILKKHS